MILCYNIVKTIVQYCVKFGQSMTTITMKPQILYDHIFMIYPECADNM